MADTRPPFFVVGCPRSGTTLLRALLRSHPRLAIPPESHVIPVFYRAYGHPRTDAQAVRLARRILEYPFVTRWNVALDPATCAGERTFGGVVARVFAAYAAQHERQRWGDKTPQYVAEMDLLREVFPGCVFVHIIRDGRDVATSWIAAEFEPRNVYVAAARWRSYVRAGIDTGRRLPADVYLEVRYEDLVAQPEAVMQRVCAHIGEPFDPAVLSPNPSAIGGISRVFGAPLPVHQLSRVNVVAGNRQKWRTAMSRRDRSVFESVAGDALDELGYETEGLTRTIGPLERGAWELHHFVRASIYRANVVDAYVLRWRALQRRWDRATIWR